MNSIFGDDYWEPRVDIEMVRSLLIQGEHEHLDFKSTIDLSSKEGKVKFIKDIVSLANTHPGGHLLIGVGDDGMICGLPDDFDWARFDSARLRDTISEYIEAPINIRSQVHDIDNQKIVIIAVTPGHDMLPIVMAKQGEYPAGSKGKSTTLFKRGEVFLREGSQNVSLRYSHWSSLLERHDKQIHEQAHANITTIIDELADRLSRPDNEKTLIPLSFDLPPESIPKAVQYHLTSGNTTELRLFVTQALNRAAETDGNTLNIASLIAVRSLFGNDPDLVIWITDELFRIYNDSPEDTRLHLNIITHLYAIGSAAVRARAWDLLRDLVLKKYPPNQEYFGYKSWIREGQVSASRINLFPEESRGLLIDLARSLMANHPELRPDIPGNLATDSLPSNDAALNSLCQFDFLQLLLQQLPSSGTGDSGYPACASYSQDRVNPILNQIIHDRKLRTLLAPNETDEDFKSAFKDAYTIAQQRSFSYWTMWSPSSPAIREWVE